MADCLISFNSVVICQFTRNAMELVVLTLRIGCATLVKPLVRVQNIYRVHFAQGVAELWKNPACLYQLLSLNCLIQNITHIYSNVKVVPHQKLMISLVEDISSFLYLVYLHWIDMMSWKSQLKKGKQIEETTDDDTDGYYFDFQAVTREPLLYASTE